MDEYEAYEVSDIEESAALNDVSRSRDAHTVLNNNEFKRSFLEYRAELFDAFGKTKSSDTSIREDIYRQVKSLDVVEGKLIQLIEDGEIAREKLSIWKKIKNTLK